MELIFEILLQFIIEIFGQVIFEILAELGIRSISNALGFEKPKNPFLAAFGYIILASISAGISLYFFSIHYVKRSELRLINLIISPLLVGGLMGVRGRFLVKKQKEPIRIDSFFYGYLFAITFALIRFFFAH